MKKLIAGCMLVIASMHLSAQSSLSGVVNGISNKPLQGATVFFPELNKGTVTGPDGQYLFTELPQGRVRIQVSYLGYASHIETILLKPSSNKLDIILHPAPIEAEGIVVTGGYNSSQHENAVKVDIFRFDRHDVKVSPNFTSLLTAIPGVDMISKGSGVSKPVIRGLSMNDILVLNNGVRFENYQYSSHHPLGIDEFGIGEVEVIKGPASLMYGSDAIGGVVNFIKEKPAPVNTVEGDYSLQLFSNSLGLVQNLGVKASSEKFFYGIRTGMKSHADYLQGGGTFVPNSRFNEVSVKANAGYTGKSGTYRLFYDYSDQKLGLVEEESFPWIPERGRQEKVYYQNILTQMLSSQNKMYFGRIRLEANIAWQSTTLTHVAEEAVTEIEMNLGTLNYESKLRLPSSRSSEYILGIQGMNQWNTNLNHRETILLPDAFTGSYSAFAMVQQELKKHLIIQTGVRYDYRTLETDETGLPGSEGYRKNLALDYGNFSGSAGATLQLNECVHVRANIAKAYRTPNLAELSSNGPHETRYEMGDQKLVPENSAEADLSLHFHTNTMTADLAVFRNIIHDYIFIAPTSDTASSGMRIYRYQQDDARLQGGEAGIHLHPGSVPWLHIEATCSLVNGEHTGGEPLPFIPPLKASLEGRVEKEKLGMLRHAYISAKSSFAAKQQRPANDETETNGYALLDIAAGAEITLGRQLIRTDLGISNLFDTTYIDHLSTLKEVNLYNPGRNLTLNVQVPFGCTRHPKEQKSLP